MIIKELDRLDVILQIKSGIINQREAAESLGLTDRQIRRLLKKYRSKGAVGLISKKRGSLGNHRLKESLKELVLGLIRDRYASTNPAFVHEKMIEVHKLKISLGSVRKIMLENGLWQEYKIKKKCTYQLRERRPCKGELKKEMDHLTTGLKEEALNVAWVQENSAS